MNWGVRLHGRNACYVIFYIVQYKSVEIPQDVFRSRNSKIMTLQKHQSWGVQVQYNRFPGCDSGYHEGF